MDNQDTTQKNGATNEQDKEALELERKSAEAKRMAARDREKQAGK